MNLNVNLNLTNTPAPGVYTPIPAGVYTAICIEFDVVEARYGKGAKVKFEVIEGQFKGRKVSDYFILVHNTSPQAQDIGQRRLRAWCDALQVDLNLDTAEPLMGKPVKIKVKIDPERTVGDKTYNEQNRVETFLLDKPDAALAKPISVARTAAVATPAARPAAAAAPAAAKAMPWKR